MKIHFVRLWKRGDDIAAGCSCQHRLKYGTHGRRTRDPSKVTCKTCLKGLKGDMGLEEYHFFKECPDCGRHISEHNPKWIKYKEPKPNGSGFYQKCRIEIVCPVLKED